MELKEYRIVENPTLKAKDNKIITLEDYCLKVKFGVFQDQVIAGRKAKQQGDIELYKKIKSESVFITPTGIYNPGEAKEKKNLIPNGLVVIDVDTELTKEQEHALYNDKYTYVIHRSFGGDGFCIFVRIDPNMIDYAYHAVSKYYLEQYDIVTDKSCSNSNRGRYASFDPDIHINEKAPIFKVKIEKKDKAPVNTSFVFTDSDFDNILSQIRDRHIDLCQEDYYRYVRIGMALANHFGESGRQHFHYVCSFGSKYNERHANRDFTGFVKCNDGSVTIGTFYYYCKELGIDIYTDRTRTIINRVKVAKSQGNPTIQSITEALKDANNIEADESDIQLINTLINSNVDYSKNANAELTEIEQLGNFIVDAYNPTIDEITQTTYINGKRLTDSLVNDVYIACKRNFDFNVNVGDVRAILNSSYVKPINKLKDFVRDNADHIIEGTIDRYAECVYPQTEYNKWAFKKWIVGTVHNWFADFDDPIVSPLTLVLTGQKQGTGKSSFMRNIMPKELSKYFVEAKLSEKDKDSMFLLASSLIVLDDEFGGKAMKDDKEYKSISDKPHITQRRPYGRESETYRRRAGLCGTSNEVDILKDVTGNRRLLPINVERVDYDTLLSIDKTALIMEAYKLYKDGFQWRIYSDEDIQYIYDNTGINRQVLPFEEIFFNHFSLTPDLDFNTEVVLNQGEIYEYFYTKTVLKPTKFELKDVYTKNKMVYKSYGYRGSVKKGYKLYMRSYDATPETTPF